MASKEINMTEGDSFRQMLSFAIPLTAGGVLQQAYSMADAVIAGRFLGSDALAAISNSIYVIWVMTLLFLGLGHGASIIISQLYGSGERERVKSAVDTCVVLLVACGLLCTALGILLVAIPALMAVFVCVWDERKYYLTSLLLVGLMFVPIVLRFEGRRPQARELVLLATMTALAVAGRAAFYWLPQCKPVCAIVILTAVAFTPEAGFVTGAAAGLISNFFFGQGPWTPWQMLGFGLVGFLGGVLFSGRKVQLVPLLLYGFFSVLIVYGVLLDTASMLMYNAVPSWQLWLATCASGFVFNLIHAGATAVFLLLLYKPLLSKLARVKEKYVLLE